MKGLVRRALLEDVGSGDITTNSIVSKNQKAKAIIVAKEAGVIFGLKVVKEVFRQVDRSIKMIERLREGEMVREGQVVAEISGPARGILTGERVALNFLQQLSGIATLTNQFVARVKGQGARILDTRKTTPGLRLLEKAAVKAGGGTNHRIGLFDAVLIKDNHIEAAGGIKEAVESIRVKRRNKWIEVEAKTVTEVKEAIEERADRILLDNMDLKTLRQAVKLCKKAKIETEASGGVNLKSVKSIAKTGVDYISVGALTHSARALDVCLKIV
ncbi:MAG: carboxylating nicotinate-nucleotide diphosphorylase [bacterium]